MKRLVIFFFMINLGIAINAQEYIKDGTVWHTSVVGTHDPYATEHLVTTEVIGDTLVNGVSALKVYTSTDSEPRELSAIIRVEGSKVYFWSNASEQWNLAYDFGLKQGEGCWVSVMEGALSQYYTDKSTYVYCTGISNIIVYEGTQGDAIEVPVLSLEEYKPDNMTECLGIGSWIVGIGSTRGFLSNNYFEADGIGSKLLLDVWCNEELIMSTSTPTKINEVSPKNNIKTGIVYDLNGVQCKTLKSGHIYIVDGKKIINK